MKRNTRYIGMFGLTAAALYYLNQNREKVRAFATVTATRLRAVLPTNADATRAVADSAAPKAAGHHHHHD